jgi:beta-glucosidase
LSYTTFEYADLRIDPPEIMSHDSAVVRLTLRNTGTRAGDEVPQLYLRDELASVSRPVMQLAGFQRLHLAPGESREVTFRLTPVHLRLLDREMKWIVEPGSFRIMIGSSSKDIRLRGHLIVR